MSLTVAIVLNRPARVYVVHVCLLQDNLILIEQALIKKSCSFRKYLHHTSQVLFLQQSLNAPLMIVENFVYTSPEVRIIKERQDNLMLPQSMCNVLKTFTINKEGNDHMKMEQ